MRIQRETWGDLAPSLNASPQKKRKGQEEDVGRGECVVYWMRMEDMRGTPFPLALLSRSLTLGKVIDNHALSLANNHARAEGLPLVVLFVVTRGDWRAHDRSARRVDFCLRNLRHLKVGPHGALQSPRFQVQPNVLTPLPM